MALAYLRYADSDGHAHLFHVDLGRNRYYAYTIGDSDSDSPNGVRVMRAPSYTSRVFGPVDEETLGRTDIAVPSNLFDARHNAIQLLSFRTRDRVGPAVSSIERLYGDDVGDARLPPIALARSMARDGHLMAIANAPLPVKPVRSSATIVERRPHGQYVQAQFLEVLTSLLPSLLPMAGNLLGSLFGGGGTAGAAPGGPGAPNVPPALLQFLQQLLSQVGAPPRTPATPTPPAAPAQPTLSASQYIVESQSTNGHAYSEAMIAPALLAAIPALMPLLQQVLSPQTVQSVLQTADPNRLIGTVANAINGFAQLGLQAEKQQLDHLRALNPGVDDPALMALLASMSQNLEVQPRSIKYRRVESVKLHFADVATVPVAGRTVAAYVRGHDLAFPLAVETRRTIPPGLLQMVIKNATTLEVVAEDRIRTPQIPEGRLPLVNTLSAEHLAQLKIGEDYLACAHLIWKTKSGEKVGTTMTQSFTVLGNSTFDSVEESGDLVPLNDVDKYRDFWHKVWQDSFTRDLARTQFEVKYYYLLQPDHTQNAQVDTTVSELEKGLRRSLSRLKSGLLLSPNRLNELLPRISSHPSLTEDQLAALLTPAFTKRMHLAARKHVEFGGRPGTSAALWIFPEVKVQRLTLLKPGKVASTGNVISIVPEQVYFPIPVLAHMVGVSSQ